MPSVHPRMRGERCSIRQPLKNAIGSSPHARGTQCIGIAGGSCQRFIPACAGNAVASSHAPRLRRFIPACAGNADEWIVHPTAQPVHPRMRGERLGRPGAILVGVGSSPHARGTLLPEAVFRELYRFIPACAGNAFTISQARHAKAVHPRMRGERCRPIFPFDFYPVHPRMRGERSSR